MLDDDTLQGLVMLGLLCDSEAMEDAQKQITYGATLLFQIIQPKLSRRFLSKQLYDNVRTLRSLPMRSILVLTLFTEDSVSKKQNASVALLSRDQNPPYCLDVFRKFDDECDVSVSESKVVTLLLAVRRHVLCNSALPPEHQRQLESVFNIKNISNFCVKGIVGFKKYLVFDDEMAMLRLQTLMGLVSRQ